MFRCLVFWYGVLRDSRTFLFQILIVIVVIVFFVIFVIPQ